MPITVKDIREKDFTKQVRGYSIDEVDDFLDEIAGQVEQLIRENQKLTDALHSAQSAPAPAAAPMIIAAPAPQPEPAITQSSAMLTDEPQYFRNLEATLRETLINAQRIADDTVADARRKANSLVATAEEQATAITATAKVEAEAMKTESLELRKAADEYRAKFLRLVEDQVHVLKADNSLFE